MSFLSARSSCLFCELQIGNASGETERSSPLCNSCGVELLAPYRFCGKCGTARSPTETRELDQHIDEEPADDDSFDQELSWRSFDEPTDESEAPYTSSWDYSATPVPNKSRLPWLIGGGFALLLVAILIAVVTHPKRAPRQVEAKHLIPEAPPGMVYIAGGDFMMGNNNGDEYERPAHRVAVRPFFMDVTEVTCEDYIRFLTATARRDPPGWTTQSCRYVSGRQPVTGVNWNDAKDYAGWANKRLPTEEEWEFAARGVVSAAYPWGNEWRSDAANAGESSAQRLMDVGSYPNGKTFAGVMDLIGNAWEWTSSDVVVYPGGSLSSPVPEDVKVVRGGSWQAGKQATSTYRGYLHITNAKDYSATGFRCVKNVGPVHAAEPQK